MALEPAVTLVLVWTNEAHGWIWRDVHLSTAGWLSLLYQTPGTGFWVHTVYSYLILALGTCWLIAAWRRTPRLYRGQLGALIAGACLPLAGNLLSNFAFSPLPGLDLTPFMFTLTGLFGALGLFRFQLLKIVPIAHETVFACMDDGVFVLDDQDRVVDLNPAAQHLIGRQASEVAGQSIDKILAGRPDLFDRYQSALAEQVEAGRDGPDDEREYDLHLSVLPGGPRGRQGGRLIVAHDVTERKRAEELKRSIDEIRTAMEETIQAMALLVETRDPYTAGHQRRVAKLAAAIAELMGLSGDEAAAVRLAANVHDVGKIHVPAEILCKPGSLSEIEMGLIRVHPQIGYDVLSKIGFPWPIAQIVAQHHERLDGSGYPAGLTEGGILQAAKIVGVADVVEAMSSDRPYRPALSIGEALEEISRHEGILYEPDVSAACIELFTRLDFCFD